MVASADRIRLGEKLGYAAGDFASNLFWKTIEVYLLFFYTDVYGLSAAAAGTMLLVTRVWDALVDPLIGAAADRTRSRHGRFRPYLLWMGLPLAVAATLTFTTPPFSGAGKLAWAYVTYGLMMLAYSAVNIPYSALLGVITSDDKQRISLASLKFVGAFSGGVAVGVFTPRLVRLLGGAALDRGWQLTMAVYGLAAVGLFALTFATTRERVPATPQRRARLRDDIRELAGNRPWLVLFLMGLFVILTIGLRNGTAAYYLKYCVGRPDLVSSYLTVGMIAYAVGAACTPLLTRIMDKRRAYVVLMWTVAASSVLFFFVPPAWTGALFALHALTSLALGPKSPLVWSMYADVADHAQARTGRAATGFIFAAATFAMKAGGALAGALTGWLLASVGYVANRVQDQATQRGILVLISLLPAAFAALAAFTIRFYRLGQEQPALSHPRRAHAEPVSFARTKA